MNKKKQIAQNLQDVATDARELAEELGLSPYEVKYWVVDNDEMNELIAYDGFQNRYPHWRWGMKFEQQQKKSQFGGGKAFEIVNNDNPSHAFLQQSNTLADQKAVITHVEAHADFFKNNRWFRDDPNAAEMLEKHGEKIEEYMREHGRERVEEFIDHISTIEDNIDQHSEFARSSSNEASSMEDRVEALEVDDDVKEFMFDEEWIEENEDGDRHEVQRDLLLFIMNFGGEFDEEKEKTVELQQWQKDVIRMLREEAYYFAPQKMTKVMNEGWAAYWESLMMGDENFAGDDEFVTYADHQSKVLNSQGFNPYKLGKELWEYIENDANRREMLDKLFRVEGITPSNIKNVVNWNDVFQAIQHPESDDYEKKHYSLARPQNRNFVKETRIGKLEEEYRYIMDDARYSSVEEAIADVDYGAGWEKMREVRENKNDVTFIDEFLTPEFVTAEEYFTYEYSSETDNFRVASRQAEDVKKKLLLQFTNFGKPQIQAVDNNYKNRNEVLLEHNYNGVMLDINEAKETLKHVYELCGRKVNLKTIVKTTDDAEEGRMLKYDGEGTAEVKLDWSEVEHLAAGSVDYDTKPDEWM